VILLRLYPAVLSKAVNSALVRSRPPVITIMFRSRSLLKQWSSSSGTTTSTSNSLSFPVHSETAIPKDLDSGIIVPIVNHATENVGIRPLRNGMEEISADRCDSAARWVPTEVLLYLLNDGR
jgi:hypothetical protein